MNTAGINSQSTGKGKRMFKKNLLFLIVLTALICSILAAPATVNFFAGMMPGQIGNPPAENEPAGGAGPGYDLVTAAGREAALRRLLAYRSETVQSEPAADGEYDIVVYGATGAGISAAIQATRLGKSVVLLAESDHIGGMTSSGLGATDINRIRAVGGIAREFYQLIYLYYSAPEVWARQSRADYFLYLGTDFWSGRSDSLQMMWMFEPQAAQLVYRFMLGESGVAVAVNERLDLTQGVSKAGSRLTAIRTESGKTFRAKVFIDASYEGDLMAEAGVSFVVGREPNTAYGETVNGIRSGGELAIDPYREAGNPTSGLLPYIEPTPPGEEGSGDHRIQAYTYRFTLTDDPANQVLITKPDNYDPLLYEFLARWLESDPGITLGDILVLTPLPNRKTDTNHADFIGANYAWPEGDYRTREEIAASHRNYILGLLWFLANDARVPPWVREDMRAWGLAADEFTDNGNFPSQIYVREARRMVSDYVVTEKDVLGSRVADDGVGLGTYWLDSHVVCRYLAADGRVREEGKLWGSEGVYPISYRAIVPQAEEGANLLVPVALSASHVAYGSLRMEPVYMVLGQSAATAAAIAVDLGCTVQQVPYQALRTLLLRDKQILDPSAVKAPNGSDVELEPYLNVLAGARVITEPEYWFVAAAGKDSFRADKAAELIIALARQIDPAAADLTEAAAVLQAAGIIGTPDYWVNTAGQGIDPDREYVVKLIIAAASKLR